MTARREVPVPIVSLNGSAGGGLFCLSLARCRSPMVRVAEVAARRGSLGIGPDMQDWVLDRFVAATRTGPGPAVATRDADWNELLEEALHQLMRKRRIDDAELLALFPDHIVALVRYDRGRTELIFVQEE